MSDKRFAWACAVFICLMVLSVWISFSYGQSEGIPTITSEANLQSGSSNAVLSGASVVAIIDIERLRVEGGFTFQPGIIYFKDDGGPDAASGATPANPNGTGIGDLSGVTAAWFYGISNKHLSVAEWEKKVFSAITKFHEIDLGSGNTQEPVEFVPEGPVVEVAIFFSGSSAFKIPKGTYVVQ